jgi:hypothetical protein
MNSPLVMRPFLPSCALRFLLCFIAGLRIAVAAPPDAWPGDDYTGPLTPVSGTLGGASTPLLVYGAYPAAGSAWRYKLDFTDTTLAQFIATHGNAWRNEGFDESSWAQGASQIGYGDAVRDEVTLTARTDYSSTVAGTQSGPVGLFRAQFSIPSLANVGNISGRVLFDDSCAVFVNGVQVYRHGDLTANAPLTEYTETTTTLTRENAEADFTVPLGLLHDGTNTIAVEVHQHDAASTDLSFDLRLSAAPAPMPEIQWTAAGGPYHLTGDVTVPAGTTLVIGPGTRVFADSTRRLIVNGVIKVQGTAAASVQFSHLPGAPLEDDPREPGIQTVPPKWGGILVQDSLSPENRITQASFYGAQPAAVEGSITVIRASCVVEHCLFAATYLHGVYGKNCSLTVQDSVFPDVFPPGKEALGEVLDNLSEFVEVDSPPNDPAIVGNPNFVEGFPVGGVLRLYRNHFYGSSGHNDLVDITSGKWGVTPILDVQDNHFHGPVGDEHIDLNGDAYIAGNIFENCTKDQYTSDNGYANAISSDVGDLDTTIVVVRNVFTHCDHAVNVKRGAGVIFEHNTVADVNADYLFVRDEGEPDEFTQTVAGSAINFFIPEDTGRPGDGAYAAWNIIHGGAGNAALPRVLSWADRDLTGQPQKTTKLEFFRNIVDPLVIDPVIGSQHPDNVLAAVWQTTAVDPVFTDRASRNYTLAVSSPVRTAGPFGLPPGHTIPAGCYLGNQPPAATSAAGAAITVGGPGIFAYQWRLDGGAWSAPISIAPGVFPRTGATIRTTILMLENLAEGTHTLEVIGQDFAGNWQTTPTTSSWFVSTTPPADYPLWLTWHGVAGGSDTDADDLNTLLEYAFGTSPHIPGPQPGALAAAPFGITFHLPENAALTQGHGRRGVVYQVEASEDLSPTTWTAIAVKAPGAAWTGNVTIDPAIAGLVPVTVLAPVNTPRLFLRARVTYAP